MKINNEINFFIVGVGRSGTSLLQSILSSHSDICIPPETGFVRHNILSKTKLNDYSINTFLESNDRLNRLLKFLPSSVLDQSFKNEFDFYSKVMTNYKMQRNKEMIGDKDPRLIEYLFSLNKLFPGSKIINLVRDPRDVLLSKSKANWSSKKPNLYHIFANYIQLEIGERIGKRFPESTYITISYEELIENPKEILNTLCDFLDIEYEDSMLEFQSKAKELVSSEEHQWKKETMGPLLKNNSGKWIGKLNKLEVALSEKLCTIGMQKSGAKKQ